MTPEHAPPTQGAPVLIISHDVVGSHMAGPGIRVWEFARVLAQQQPVTLIAPQPIDLVDPPFPCGSYVWGNASSLAPWLADAAIVVANGYVLQAHPELATIPQPLALDLYDPVLLENLELFRTAPEEKRTAQIRQDIALLNAQLAAGDFFLCATERQRDLYLGALMTAGRVTPEATDRDPLLRTLIDVAPFGLPAEPSVQHQSALRGVMPGIGADDLVVLWAGGLWDWLDPLTLVRALPGVVDHHGQTRVVFLAGQHPGNDHRMRVPEQTKALAEELGLLGRHVFFYEQWVPYERRADFLLDADIAVSLHHDHLETRYAAVRSRVLDHLWAGLSSLLSAGDPAAELLSQAGAALVVPPGSTAEVTAALDRLLGDHELRVAQRAAARQLATRFTWAESVAPLARFCRSPRRNRSAASAETQRPARAPERPLPSGQGETPMPGSHNQIDGVRNAAIAVQEQTWRLQERPLGSSVLNRLRRLLIDHVVRPFVQPMIEQQQEYNAAVLRTTYTLAESADRRRSEIQEQLTTLQQKLNSLSERTAVLAENDRIVRDELYAIATQLHGLEEADTQLALLVNEARPTAAAEEQL